MSSDLEACLASFVVYYNYRRYQKALGYVTPSDVIHGGRAQILLRGKEAQARTIRRSRHYNPTLRKFTTASR